MKKSLLVPHREFLARELVFLKKLFSILQWNQRGVPGCKFMLEEPLQV